MGLSAIDTREVLNAGMYLVLAGGRVGSCRTIRRSGTEAGRPLAPESLRADSQTDKPS